MTTMENLYISMYKKNREEFISGVDDLAIVAESYMSLVDSGINTRQDLHICRVIIRWFKEKRVCNHSL